MHIIPPTTDYFKIKYSKKVRNMNIVATNFVFKIFLTLSPSIVPYGALCVVGLVKKKFNIMFLYFS